MNKKEVLEIRKQFSPKNCAITKICGCYVDYEKNKKMESKDAFLALPEEEAFKYFDIFKKTLSGSIGKNMLNMEFPLDAEMPGGTQEFLLKLRDSRLEDDMLLEEFYDKVIATYEYAENYYIILIHAAYDVPGRTSDDLEMDDASDEVYQHILMSICPVSQRQGLAITRKRTVFRTESVTGSLISRTKDSSSRHSTTEVLIFTVCFITRRNQKIFSRR